MQGEGLQGSRSASRDAQEEVMAAVRAREGGMGQGGSVDRQGGTEFWLTLGG